MHILRTHPYILVAAVALILLITIPRAVAIKRGKHARVTSPAKTLFGGLGTTAVLLLLLFFALYSDDKVEASGNKPERLVTYSVNKKSGATGLDCPKDTPGVADPDNWHLDDDGVQHFAANGGNLVGHGVPLADKSAGAAGADLYNRTFDQPDLTAKLAYAMRLSGFIPQDQVSQPGEGQPLERGTADASVEFLNQKAAALVRDHKLWSQTRKAICSRLGAMTLDSDPYKDRNLLELARRVQDTVIDKETPLEVTLPATAVLLNRATQPDGVRLLWIDREVDTTGERPNKFPIAIDVQFVYPAIVGEIPESAEQITAPPPPPAPAGTNEGQDNTGGGSGKPKAKGGGNTGHNGGKKGCHGDCGSGNTDRGTSKGPGVGGCASTNTCEGGGGNDSNTGCGNGCGTSPTPTTAPGCHCTTAPPVTHPAPTTTRPCNCTTAPPPTTTSPPRTTVPPTTAPPTTRPPTTVPPTTTPRTTTTTRPAPTTTIPSPTSTKAPHVTIPPPDCVRYPDLPVCSPTTTVG